MNIVITFGVADSNFSIWTNGISQNVLFLYMLLKQIKGFNVYLVNLGLPIEDLNHLDDIFNLNEFTFTDWSDIENDVDFVIEAGMKLEKSIVARLRQRGVKVVLYVMGNLYIFHNEEIIFKNPNNELYYDNYDEVWLVPQHEKLCKYYIEELFKCPVKVVPAIWDSYFIDKYNLSLKQNNMNPYYKYEGWMKRKKDITIFEPNLNIIKTSLYPMLIAERAYNKRPELFGKIRVLNSIQFAENTTFLSFVSKLNIHKHGITTYEARFNTPYVLSEYTDIVITTQWENEINYLYLDILYNKYPLIHNSSMMKKAGYYYKDFDIETASEKLIKCIVKDDSSLNNKRSTKLLDEFSIYNINNITAHKDAILNKDE